MTREQMIDAAVMSVLGRCGCHWIYSLCAFGFGDHWMVGANVSLIRQVYRGIEFDNRRTT